MSKQTIELIILSVMIAGFILYALGFEPEAVQAEQETITHTEALVNNAVDISEDNYKITHVYEDGCLEVMDEVDGDIKFYCEADFK